jgi:arabinan endo-1,5-alpha-L-arabinosidase
MLNLNPASQPLMPMKHTGIGLRVNGMAVLALASFSLFAIASEASPAATTALNGSMTGAAVAPYVRDAFVHDPSTLIKCKDEFWVFATGRGVPSWHSKDLVNWEHGPSVFTSNAPPWVAEAVPANRPLGYWAPDLTYLNGRYLLYYSASTFGHNVSGIGLVTSPTLDPSDPAYGWTDQGLIIASAATNDFNAIDPAIFHEANGSLWLTFGSFWSGIKMIQLDPQTGKRLAPDFPILSLAHSDAIEASYLYQHGRYYYLFVNWGLCCRGTNSTYSIHVGRSQNVTGPYLDREGRDMLYGGGTLFLDTTKPYFGPGHSGIMVDNGTNWFSCHYEAATDADIPGQRRGSRLAVMPLRWTADDWPQVDLKQDN